MTREDWPGALAFHARAHGLPSPVREYRFAPPRRWRMDLAWPELRVYVEVDGGGWVGGRHGRGQGIENDCEKVSEAAARGWRLVRVTPAQVRDGRAIAWVVRALLDGPPWE